MGEVDSGGTLGWIKLWRAVRENPDWDDKPYARGQAWIDLLMRASWKDSAVRYQEHVINLTRGQLAASTRQLSRDWGWSRDRVEVYLKSLHKLAAITTTKQPDYNVITICNYEYYQCDVDESSHKTATNTTTKQPQTGQRPATVPPPSGHDIRREEGEEEKNPKPPPSSPPTGGNGQPPPKPTGTRCQLCGNARKRDGVYLVREGDVEKPCSCNSPAKLKAWDAQRKVLDRPADGSLEDQAKAMTPKEAKKTLELGKGHLPPIVEAILQAKAATLDQPAAAPK